MPRLVVAAQLYTVREYTKTAKDFAASMRKVRAAGYRAVQISAVGPIAPTEVKSILDGEGLVVPTSHASWRQLCDGLPAVIAEQKTYNCPNVAVGTLPEAYRGSEETFRRFAGEATEIGRKLAEAGLTFSYHNHSFEFVRFGARTGLDIIYDESDPRYLNAEIDTYWVQHGGGDPAAWIRRVKGRMPVVHFKDMAIIDGQQAWAEIGEGNLNWPAILDACREAGVGCCAVEQDLCRRDPFESLAISYRYLKAMGLE